MPVDFVANVIWGKVTWLPSLWTMAKVVPAVLVIVLVKLFSAGVKNSSERKMHGKVVLVTGGTSGIGAAAVLDLASRGAQIVLLTRQSPTDMFLVDYIEDLRERSGNELIYAEQVDLSSLYSVRKFATKWINNAPPRRLDMIVLCAATLTPPGRPRVTTAEGIEETWMVNYLANFHLLSILSPAIRAQPPDRDVRIIFTTCSSYDKSPIVGDGSDAMKKKDWSPSVAYARSKMALMIFGQAFQKHLESYKRPDEAIMNARVIFVDPGYCRTPGFRRWGAQSISYAAMEGALGRGPGGKLIKECSEINFTTSDVKDEKIAKKLWEGSEKLIERVEREEAVKRALEKKEKEAAEKANGSSEKPSDSSETTEKATENSKGKSRRQRKAK
ncbi:short chain dehydrogenase reductase family [Botrytis cinerea]